MPVLAFGVVAAVSGMQAAPEPPKAEGPVPGSPKTGPPGAPSNREGLHVGIGLFTGTHRPELEDRFRNDRFFAALLFNGYGTTTEWESTTASGLPWFVRYNVRRWQVGFENSAVISHPRYTGILSATIPTAPTPIVLSALDQTAFDPLVRANTTLSGGYLLNPDSSIPVHLLFGLRSFSLGGDYRTIRLTRASIGTLSAEGLEATVQGHLEGAASGPVLGAEMLLALNEKWRLWFRARLFRGSGSWSQTSISVKSSGSGEYGSEEGLYEVLATEIELGVNYQLSTKGNLFVRFTLEQMTARDAEVVLIKVSSVASENNNRGFEFALTYPGSSQKDRLSGLTFGYEHRFNL